MIGYHRIETPKEEIYADAVPDICPFCKSVVHFQPINVFTTDDTDIQVVFRCPKNGCGKYTVGLYKWTENIQWDTYSYAAYSLYDTIPETPLSLRRENFPDEVLDISPHFDVIYNQAYAAEQMRLGEITGVGYRKALEFLIKDFAGHKYPDQQSKILSTPLASCIKLFIDDPRIKKVAERAVWLGNDETHYLRKWSDKDIHDLKLLIQLTIFLDNKCSANGKIH